MAEPPPEVAARVAVMRDMAERYWDDGEFFFYVRIPESLTPHERGERYEDPLAAALRRAKLGRVTGGGQQLGANNTILYCGVDVVLKERVRGLELLRRVLRRLHAPEQTIIEEHWPTYQEHRLAPEA